MEFGYVGINYKNANQDVRDKVSFTDNQKIDFMQKASELGVEQGRKKRNSQDFRQQGCAGMCHYEKETTRLPPQGMTASCASTMKFSRSIKPEPGANRQEYF